MIAFDPKQSYGLEWHQDSAFSRRYQLKSGDSVLAELAFAKVFGTLAEASTARFNWTFKRRGVFTSSVAARIAGQENDVAVYRPNWTTTKGLLRLASGEEFELHTANFWASEWVLSVCDGAPLLEYHNRGFLKHGASVELEPAGREHPQLELLITLVWYILLLHQMDSAASTSAVVAAG
jgi:hypothetical protein